ncbi:MAG: lytic murein transglycosylase [Plesiomonas sp.]
MKRSLLSVIALSLSLSGCAAETAAESAVRNKPAQRDAGQNSAAAVHAVGDTAHAPVPVGFAPFIEQLKQQAIAQGLAPETVARGFANVYFLERAVHSDRGQPEFKLTLSQYLQKSLTPAKIQKAREMYQQYRPLLTRIGREYGVQPQYIVALWGSESSFGRYTGNEDVISALSTLAFEGRRKAFFTQQVMAALEIQQQGHIAPEQMKGSWAGAMGQCQFMPTSFLTYAADGDGDGHKDIWNNVADVFASTANYLATEGWNDQQSWGMKVRLPAGLSPALAGTKTEQGKTLGQWQKRGVRLSNGANLPQTHPQQKVWLVIPDDDSAQAMLVYNNYRTLMHWNRSYYFATSVGMLADAIIAP